MQLGLATIEGSLDEALELGRRALRLAQDSQRVVLVGATFEAEAIVLGQLQREASVRELSPARLEGKRVLRRCTTGTEAQLQGGVVYHALALPRVDALYSDASSRTLLNRNLRAILRGYAAVGIPLRYFGTEVLALLGHPIALVGYDKLASGAVLIELLIGLENPCVVRPALPREPPASLFAVLGAKRPGRDLLASVMRGVVDRLGATNADVLSELSAAGPVADRAAPPGEAVSPSRVSVPIGVVEAVTSPSVRVTGDLLTSVDALQAVETLALLARRAGNAPSVEWLAPLSGEPLDGARPEDVLSALRQAWPSG